MGSASLRATQSSTAAPQPPGRQLFSAPHSSPRSLASPPQDVPSKSSMVFSSLATERSANSARVSACRRERGSQRDGFCHTGQTHLSLPTAHLFEFIGQDLDLFLVFILFLGVLQGRKAIGDLQPSAASCISCPKAYSYKGTLQLPTAVRMPTNFQTLSPRSRRAGSDSKSHTMHVTPTQAQDKLSSQQH